MARRVRLLSAINAPSIDKTWGVVGLLLVVLGYAEHAGMPSAVAVARLAVTEE